jgi:hypothetical protein
VIDDGERSEDVAALLNVDRTTLYMALAAALPALPRTLVVTEAIAVD